MIELIENLPKADVISIMTQDDIWEFVSEDGMEKNEYDPIMDHSGLCYLGIYVNNDLAGLFLVHPDNGLTSVKVHIAILKGYRALYAVGASEKLIEWFIALPDRVQKLNATIPEYNKGAIRLTIEAGFKVEGINRQSIMRNGMIYDQHQFGITRKEAILCQQR